MPPLKKGTPHTHQVLKETNIPSHLYWIRAKWTFLANSPAYKKLSIKCSMSEISLENGGGGGICEILQRALTTRKLGLKACWTFPGWCWNALGGAGVCPFQVRGKWSQLCKFTAALHWETASGDHPHHPHRWHCEDPPHRKLLLPCMIAMERWAPIPAPRPGKCLLLPLWPDRTCFSVQGQTAQAPAWALLDGSALKTLGLQLLWEWSTMSHSHHFRSHTVNHLE